MLHDATSEENRRYEDLSREVVRERQKSVDRWWERPCDMWKLFEEPPDMKQGDEEGAEDSESSKKRTRNA